MVIVTLTSTPAILETLEYSCYLCCQIRLRTVDGVSKIFLTKLNLLYFDKSQLLYMKNRHPDTNLMFAVI